MLTIIMTVNTIELPNNLLYENTIDFVNEFMSLDGYDKYIFNFEKLRFIDPFSLLYLSSAIEYFIEKNNNSKFAARNYKHLSYPAHVGFFKSFGLDYGNEPGEAPGSNTYIPITVCNVKELRKKASESFIHSSEYMDEYAGRISAVLTQNSNNEITKIMRYCIREILRNITEHSQSEDFRFCVQYLPSFGIVNFAVIDHGIGLLKSLSKNPYVEMNDDLEAIRRALEPGISGKVYSGMRNPPKGEWANSGYGLYMTSRLCSDGGSFFISSGSKGLYLSEKKERIFDLEMQGTAINLRINLNKIKNLDLALKSYRETVPKNVKLKPSKSSMDNFS